MPTELHNAGGDLRYLPFAMRAGVPGVRDQRGGRPELDREAADARRDAGRDVCIWIGFPRPGRHLITVVLFSM